jgi:extracellular factor (EF) 3-hydroxypalmitic acid methyl ester biosynthesis protein
MSDLALRATNLHARLREERDSDEPDPASHRPSSRARRLRTRRLKTEDLQLGDIHARAHHAALGWFDCDVEDLSLNGMALMIPRSASLEAMALLGDRLDSLEVRCQAGVIFRGSASVRRVSEHTDTLVLGIEVLSGGLDLAELYRLGTRYSFAERLQAVVSNDDDDGIGQEFKAWVADLCGYLERTQHFLDQEEKLLENLDRYSREQALETYLEEAGARVVERLNMASAQLRELVRGLNEEQHQAHRAYYRTRVLPLMQVSPLLRRASMKPLGYAGDYEMMNMLYRHPAEGTSLFAKILNVYGSQEPAAQAVVNRLSYLGAKIRRAVEVRGRVRVASVGCGPARELALLLEQSPELGQYLDVALIDQEGKVLTYCERTLAPLIQQTGVRVHFIRESVRRLLVGRGLGEALGQRDLIYSAGLFDYLDTRSFGALLSALYDALTPTGHLVVGNYSDENPSRFFMEYCLDWYLIHRSREELEAFARDLQPQPSRVTVDGEPLGVNIFLNVWK